MNSYLDSDSSVRLIIILFSLDFQPLSFFLLFISLIALLLIVSITLLGGAQAAIFSLSSNDLQELQLRSSKRYQYLIRLMEKPRYLLTTINVLQTFFSVLLVLLIGLMIIESTLINLSQMRWWVLLPEIVVVTVLMIVLQHIIPRTFAEKNNIVWTLWTLPGLFFLEKLFKPFTLLAMRGVSVTFNNDDEKKKNEVKIYGANETPENISPEKQEARFLKGILKFGSTQVKEVMKPRFDMIALDAGKSFEEILKVVKDSGYSRMPVYRNIADNVIGILYTKDMLQFLQSNNEVNWLKILRPAFFVPEGKKISDLLLEFQAKMLHIAVVIDEYGSTAGIVTLEDILEEIIGEIRDELDEKTDFDFTQLDKNNFVFEGKTLLNDMYRAMGIKDQPFEDIKGDVDSIGGLILELSGKIPEVNEEIDFKKFRFKVLNMDNHRIRRVKVTLLEEVLI